MNTDIASLLVRAARDGQVSGLLLITSIGSGGSSGRCRVSGLKLLVGVVDEILFVRHGGGNGVG